jgi:hypothetical protein
MVKMGDPTWKISKIALSNLGTWLHTQMSMSMVKNMWQSLSRQSKTGKDVFLGTLSQTSAAGEHLGWCSGVHMWWGGEICLEELQGFPCLTVSLQDSQWTRGANSYVSEQCVKVPILTKLKQINMDSILLYAIDNDQLALGNRKDSKNKNNKKTIP